MFMRAVHRHFISFDRIAQHSVWCQERRALRIDAASPPFPLLFGHAFKSSGHRMLFFQQFQRRFRFLVLDLSVTHCTDSLSQLATALGYVSELSRDVLGLKVVCRTMSQSRYTF